MPEINPLTWQWIILIGFSILLILLSPVSREQHSFFRGRKTGDEPGVFMLSSSLLISWIFAKSITNAANLGFEFGLPGGVAYAAYYLSFFTAGYLIFRLRIRGGFGSIHQFLSSKFGRGAVTVFSVLISLRLFNEIWSNTMVIGTYFGDVQSSSYYLAILVFTGLTLVYSLKGGMKSSLLTDVIQMLLFGILLMIILIMILPQGEETATDYINSGEWSLAGGVDLLFVAVLQSLSYPFHDPVMTDRAFLSSPKKMLKSFVIAGTGGLLAIILFSLTGVFASFQGLQGQAPVAVSAFMGPVMMLLMNAIMITSAASTLDSAFTSFSKLAVVDLGLAGKISVKKGRLMMAGLTLLGTLPVFLNPEILDATTISGTMVLGLGPVFVFRNIKTSTWSFYLSVSAGIFIGLWYLLADFPDLFGLPETKYSELLSANLCGFGLVILMYFTGLIFRKYEE